MPFLDPEEVAAEIGVEESLSWRLEAGNEQSGWLRVYPKAPIDETSISELEAILRKEAKGVDGVALEIGAADSAVGGTELPALTLKSILHAIELSGAACKRLNLSARHLGDDAACEIAQFISRRAGRIDEVDLSNNRLTALGLAHLGSALANHSLRGYPHIEETNVARAPKCTPCWLELRGNAIDEPVEAVKILRSLGVVLCTSRRCSRMRCAVGAPIQLAGGFADQIRPIKWTREEIMRTLGPQQATRPVRRRRGHVRKVIPPAPWDNDAASTAANAASHPMVTTMPALRPGKCSPLLVPEAEKPYSPGNLVQALRDCGRGQDGQPIPHGTMLKVVSAPLLAVVGTGCIQVTQARNVQSTLGGDPGLAWVQACDLKATPVFQ